MTQSRPFAVLAMIGATVGLILLKIFVTFQLTAISAPPVTLQPTPPPATVPNQPPPPTNPPLPLTSPPPAPAVVPPEQNADQPNLPPAVKDLQDAIASGEQLTDPEQARLATSDDTPPPMSDTEKMRLARSGCLPGRKVIPTRGTTFMAEGSTGSGFVANEKDILVVDNAHPANADLCFVFAVGGSGGKLPGNVPLNAIAPYYEPGK